MTPTTPAVLTLYRQFHRIRPVRDYDEDSGRFIQRCSHDGLRIHTTRSGYRHDATEIKALAGIERGEGIRW